jgi:hypothetical protein
MSTARDLIEASMRLIGALSDGETASASEASNGLSSLNRMLDRWSNEPLHIYARPREEFSLVASQSSYTLGASGNFNTTRPVRIDEVMVEIQDSTPYEVPVKILNLQEWAAISNKATTSTYPSHVFIDDTYPTMTVYVWPVPTATHKLVLYSQKPLTSLAALTTSVSLPPGTEDAIVYNLALRLAPEYGKEPSATLVDEAAESKAAIKRTNVKPLYLQCDPAVLSRGTGFNIWTGE